MADSQADPIAVEPPPRLRRIRPGRRLINRPELGSILGLGFVLAFFALTAGGRGFLSPIGVSTWMNVAAQTGIIAAIATLLLIAGEFDLSVGSMLGFSSLFFAITLAWGWPYWFGVIVTLLLGLLVGLTNAWLVLRVGLSSLIATLAALFVLRGAAIGIYSGALGELKHFQLRELIGDQQPAWLFGGKLGPFDMAILWWIGLTIVAAYVLTRTTAGNWILATGGSAPAARALGVPVDRVKVALFVGTALAATLVGIIETTSLGSAEAIRGDQKEFEVVIAAVVGGALLTGGYGSPIGTALGGLALAMTQMGLLFIGVEANWYRTTLGLTLLAIVVINIQARRRASMSHR